MYLLFRYAEKCTALEFCLTSFDLKVGDRDVQPHHVKLAFEFELPLFRSTIKEILAEGLRTSDHAVDLLRQYSGDKEVYDFLQRNLSRCIRKAIVKDLWEFVKDNDDDDPLKLRCLDYVKTFEGMAREVWGLSGIPEDIVKHLAASNQLLSVV